MKLFYIILLLSFSNSAYAYLDPSTGSMIVQTFVAIGASLVIFLKNPKKLIEKLKMIFKK
ncbi:MAG: hypothetical protein V4525_00570 [Pseudomonadota bacterium]